MTESRECEQCARSASFPNTGIPQFDPLNSIGYGQGDKEVFRTGQERRSRDRLRRSFGRSHTMGGNGRAYLQIICGTQGPSRRALFG